MKRGTTLTIILITLLTIGPAIAANNSNARLTNPGQTITCQAEWKGYEYDKNTGECFVLSTTGCSNPFKYSTKEECETNTKTNNGIGQTIRNRVRTGTYVSESGEQIRVRELAQNRIQLMSGNSSVNCENCNITQEIIQGRTKLKLELSNGRNAEIKIMPETASIKARERLRLKNCNESINCTIELKQVGEGNNAKIIYEAKVQKQFKLFGFIKRNKEILTQIDAETGEEILTKRPWWSFLSSEKEE